MDSFLQGHPRVIFLLALMLAGAAGCGEMKRDHMTGDNMKHDDMKRDDMKRSDMMHDPAMHGSAAAPARSPMSPTVSIDNFSFDPPTITVAPGTTITWINHDDVPHTVTANDKGFASAALDTDERYTRRFATAGTYPYFCALHTHMTGQVVVK
jgi:pentapeptide MXKDX repeat protein